jgi:translation elongation factor EF-1alpha
MPLRIVVSDLVSKPSLVGKVGVGGKLDCGALAAGAQVYVLPAGMLATVKAMEVQGSAASLAVAGAAVELGLNGVQGEDVAIGSCLCHPDYPVRCAMRIKVCADSVCVADALVLRDAADLACATLCAPAGTM